MSGIGGSEFFLLCLIGLLILGPERLPRVARQIGGWIGKARQMTQSLQRQLEEEVDIKKNFGIDPKDLDPNQLLKPREDDNFSPLHSEDDEDDDASAETAGAETADAETADAETADADADDKKVTPS